MPVSIPLPAAAKLSDRPPGTIGGQGSHTSSCYGSTSEVVATEIPDARTAAETRACRKVSAAESAAKARTRGKSATTKSTAASAAECSASTTSTAGKSAAARTGVSDR